MKTEIEKFDNILYNLFNENRRLYVEDNYAIYDYYDVYANFEIWIQVRPEQYIFNTKIIEAVTYYGIRDIEEEYTYETNNLDEILSVILSN